MMDGVKTNYNISDMINTIRYIDEPWLAELDNMTTEERHKRIVRRWQTLKNQKDFKLKISTVNDIK